jgi:hypothetical protein
MIGTKDHLRVSMRLMCVSARGHCPHWPTAYHPMALRAMTGARRRFQLGWHRSYVRALLVLQDHALCSLLLQDLSLLETGALLLRA